ncbi:MAG: iron-containing alcohol dehydrogenase [Clostridia bacterium]
MQQYSFHSPVKLVIGELSLDTLQFELEVLNCKKPLIISCQMLENLGIVSQVEKFLTNQNNVKFLNIPIDSSLEIVKKIKECYLKNGCDGIVAIGGGSVIDSAKSARLLISTNVNDITQIMGYENVNKGKHVPLVAIPTTSGTGSETTSVCVIADEQNNVKKEFISRFVYPDVAILDPRTTISMPPILTATTGLDALCHAIEAMSCKQSNTICTAFATSSIKTIAEYLLPAIVDGKNVNARLKMSESAFMAGIAFSNSMVGLAHAIAHALGGVAKVPHGQAIAVVLPAVMRFNLEYVKEQYSSVLLNLAGEQIYCQTANEDKPQVSIQEVEKLIERVSKVSGMPTKLSACGVKEFMISQIAKVASTDGAVLLNPRRASIQQIEEILKSVM